MSTFSIFSFLEFGMAKSWNYQNNIFMFFYVMSYLCHIYEKYNKINQQKSQRMGICPTLSPEERAIKEHNKQLKKMLIEKVKDLGIYQFSFSLRNQLPNIQNRYLYNEGILEDIENIINISVMNKSIKTQSLAIQNIQEQLRNSCLIIQDEVIKQKNEDQNKMDEKDLGSVHENTEYQKNLKQNQSLVCQINIIYQRDFDITKYQKALKLFLKWSSMFHQHFYGGFLKPLYKSFCQSLYKIPLNELETIVDQTGVFVQYMVAIYTDIYSLRTLNEGQNGSLFKNENVFNLIMAHMFKKTKIKIFLRKVIKAKEEAKIKKFQLKLRELYDKDISYFGVQPKFQLKPLIEKKESSDKKEQYPSLDISTQYLIEKSPQIQDSIRSSLSPHKQSAYSSCLKSIQNLCQNSETPITKLKLIVQISKNITNEIYNYYDKIQKQVPELDPDNLTGIIMYLIAKVKKVQLYEQLKIAQLFTTTNCLTCISGYYLNTFNAAIQSLISM